MNKHELHKLAGEKLRELRKATGLSIFKTGRAIGVSGNYISQIERGERPASDAVLIALSDLYQVELEKLFALYNRLEPQDVLTIMNKPELRKTFTEITSNPHLTPQDLDEINKEIQAIAKKYFNKEVN